MYSILDLFSGIGGFSLGLHSASDKFYTTAFCEIEEFCQAVLKKNFKNTPIFSDIKELNEKTLKAAGAVKPFIITGGYPCQPFSVAGKRKGKDDPRNLWSEMFRLIKELKPVWVLAENVEGHIKLGLDKVLYDLESQNYTTQTFIIPATGVGANHQRKRLWIVGYSQHNGSPTPEREGGLLKQPEEPKKQISIWESEGTSSASGDVAHSPSSRARLGYQRRDTGKKGTQKSLSTIIIEMEGGREKTTGQLNPTWVEWLMGFNPLGWTELEHSEIQSFPKLQKSLERQLSRMRNKNGTKIQKNKT